MLFAAALGGILALSRGRRRRVADIGTDGVDVPVLYISLPKSSRAGHIEGQLRPFCGRSGACQHSLGVWGRDPDTGRTHPEFDRQLHGGCSEGEVGATMAHIDACATVVQRGLPAALILEDDADLQLANNWPSELSRLVATLNTTDPHWTTCQLYYDGPNLRPGLHPRRLDSWGAVAYLVSHRGAATITKMVKQHGLDSARLLRPEAHAYTAKAVADHVLFAFRGSRAYLYAPRLVTTRNDAFDMQSTIHASHTFIENGHDAIARRIVAEFPSRPVHQLRGARPDDSVRRFSTSYREWPEDTRPEDVLHRHGGIYVHAGVSIRDPTLLLGKLRDGAVWGQGGVVYLAYFSRPGDARALELSRRMTSPADLRGAVILPRPVTGGVK